MSHSKFEPLRSRSQAAFRKMLSMLWKEKCQTQMGDLAMHR